ncbi:histidine phosphatase family protein [Candidatus Pelagibacter bacterium]|nr:histidine phosphatase family protein [Candidatus Pelagibacter bacterium]MDC0448035.1 histidine phosphatase family protein [Candidatus Pelagibacter sp.]
MKIVKFLFLIFIVLQTPIKVNSSENIKTSLEQGKKLIFIRHAYAPGSGDPSNFNIKKCATQRNLNQRGKDQAQKIKFFFQKNNVQVDHVISSEWCRCKETASIVFADNYKTKNFLNSFYEERFSKNKDRQIMELKEYIKKWKGKKNLVLITHYVVISEMLNISTTSGEIVISDKNYNVIERLKISY